MMRLISDPPTTMPSCSSISCPPSCLPLPARPLLHLPVVLLEQVCSHLPPKQLLIGLAQTAKATRALLTPGCFSSHSLYLRSRELWLLSSLPPSSSVFSFLARCRLGVELWTPENADVQEVLVCLKRFSTCGELWINEGGDGLTSRQLLDLLSSPIVRSSGSLQVSGSFLPTSERDEEVARVSSRMSPPLQRPPFDWADVHLPSTTQLLLDLNGHQRPLFAGAAVFLAAHSALTHLTISDSVISVEDLTRLFGDPAALPQLSRFELRSRPPKPIPMSLAARPRYAIGDSAALVTALTATVVSMSGRMRPIAELALPGIRTAPKALAAAALLPALTSLDLPSASADWLNGWTELPELPSAFPQLQRLRLSAPGGEVDALTPPETTVALISFMQTMANRPLQHLSLVSSALRALDAPAMAQLARFQHLRLLHLGARPDGDWRLDWRDAGLFNSITAGCLTNLHSLEIEAVQLGANAVVAIASAVPHLRQFNLSNAELSCHPAVVCAIVGGYCAHIEVLRVADAQAHLWEEVQALDISNAHRTALATTGKDETYRPFTQLRHLSASVCHCTSPSVWHALLLLLRAATHLRLVECLASNDPLSIAALAYLPSIHALSAECLWPPAFAAFLQRTPLQTPHHPFLVSADVSTADEWICPFPGSLALSERVERDTKSIVHLQPDSGLIASFNRSLGAAHQAVLALWARGEVDADDGQLSGTTEPKEVCERAGGDRAACAHAHHFARLHAGEYEDLGHFRGGLGRRPRKRRRAIAGY